MDRSTFRTDDMGCPPWSWYFSKVNLATGGKDLVGCLPILYPSCEFRLIGLQVHRGLTWINRPKWGLTTTTTTFTYIFYYILWFNIIIAGCILILVRFNNICPATLARCRLFAKQSDLEIKNSEPTGLTRRKVGFSDVSDTTWLWWPDWTKQKCSLYN